MAEKGTVLGAAVVSNCVAQLGRFGTGLHHPYYHLAIPGRKLGDISILCKYVHLQKLELPNNRITDLSCVSHMPFLVILDVSYNEISEFFGFEPPKNLKEVNFSHNYLTEMKDMSAYDALVHLDLDHNQLEQIHGLDKCCKLTHLSVAHNKITNISGLDHLPLSYLNLRGNLLTSTEGLENLSRLQVLDLCLNHISSLVGLSNLHLLGSINLEKNQVSELEECKYIHNLLLLRDLNLFGNPVQREPDYRLSVVFLLQHLTILDQERVTVEEKVFSINKFDPPMEVVAARDHMTQLMYQLMQPQILYNTTLPSNDAPYPMLVLTGPQGCGKRQMAHRLCTEFDKYLAYGISHTTRAPFKDEVNGRNYHFVSEEEFQLLEVKGVFVQTMTHSGHRYGLSRGAIEDVAREGLGCCVHMELEGVLSLKKTVFEPCLILIAPTLSDNYRAVLRYRNRYTDSQIEEIVPRIEVYTDFNRRRPGFFNNVIRCDYWDKAYQVLQRVVMNYLMLENHEECQAEESRSDSSVLSHPAAVLDPPDPLYRNYSNKSPQQLAPHKNPTELLSICKREEPVREAVIGRCPEVYSWLIRSSDDSRGHSPDPTKGLDPPGRPGSGVKPVLPPIPPGRRTLRANSPKRSPRRSRVQAGMSG
ncbi:leucine-rich repeat and guanylate kinase domain-containing protein [Stigmatopora nigra]